MLHGDALGLLVGVTAFGGPLLVMEIAVELPHPRPHDIVLGLSAIDLERRDRAV